MNPDVALFHFLNGFAGLSPALDWLVRGAVNDYALPTLFALVLGAFWFSGKTEAEGLSNQRAVLFTLVGIAVANITMRLWQNYFFFQRPFATEQVKLLFYRPSVSSFPSVPVATMLCYTTGIGSANRKLGRVLLALTIAFGLARVIAGVHYPIDIIGGALWGFVSTWLPLRYARFLDPVFSLLLRLGQQLNLA
jgi:undecaprenyl-diphosphatase